MKTKLFIGILFTLLTPDLYGYPGESITLDTNGDYHIVYWNGAKLVNSKFTPATKIVPAVRSNFKVTASEYIGYHYSIANGTKAKQSIISINISGLPSLYSNQSVTPLSSEMDLDAALIAYRGAQGLLISPNHWDGLALNDSDNVQLVNASWDFPTDSNMNVTRKGIPPGAELHGFGFSSFALPGIGIVKLEGDAPIDAGYADEGPDSDSAISQQLDQIEKNNFVSRNAAVPTIAVPVPFEAAVLLERIRTHVSTWTGKQLLDSAYAAQLDRYLVAAAEAYRLNNTKSGKEHIETLRKMLAKEHHNVDHDDENADDSEERKAVTRLSIDRLAARVLDFDLRYVLKRMEHEHNDGERTKERD